MAAETHAKTMQNTGEQMKTFSILLILLVAVLGYLPHASAQYDRRRAFQEMQRQNAAANKQMLEQSQKQYELENQRAGIKPQTPETQFPAPQSSYGGEVDPMIERRRQKNLQRMRNIAAPSPLPAHISKRCPAAQEVSIFTIPGLESRAMGPLQLDKFR